MKQDYPLYWFAINHGHHFIKSVKDVVLFDDMDSLEKMLIEPTIFIANHTSTLDIPHMHYAIQSKLKNNPQNNNRLIKTISKDDNYNSGGFLGYIKNFVFNSVSQKMGAMLIKQEGSENKIPRKSPIFQMLSAISKGNHVLIYPMGGVSDDGTVDYKREDIDTFEFKYLSLISRRAPNINMQTIHYTIDPVYNKFIMRLGDRQLIKDLVKYDFKEEIAKCTTITGLQLFYLYAKHSMDLGILHSGNSLNNELNLFSEKLKKEGYNLYVPKQDFNDVFEYVSSRRRYVLDINYESVNIANKIYQLNQIKHLELDEVAVSFLKSKFD